MNQAAQLPPQPVFQNKFFFNHDATEHALQTMKGISAPEVSYVSPPTKSVVANSVAEDSKIVDAVS